MIRASARSVCIAITGLLIASFVPAHQPNDKPSAEDASQVKDVSSWLTANAVRCDSEDLSVLADLQPLRNTIKGVRVIGVGEATHGAREFFSFRHRLLVFLVRHMGFRTLALETGYSSAGGLDAFVQGENPDVTEALAQQGLWTWDTEEMRGILDWLRRYNTRARAQDRVRIVGFDIHYNEPGKREILAYLTRVAPERVVATKKLFTLEMEKLLETAFFTKDERERKDILAKIAELRAGYDELLGFLTVNELRFTSMTSAAEFSAILGYARVLAQLGDACDRPLKEADGPMREYYMAENIKRAVDVAPPKTGVIVWAHNGHISKGKENGTDPFMGFHLQRFFDNAYYALAFSFNQGSFQARDYRPTGKRAVMSFVVSGAPEGTIDWYLARPGIKTYFVDLRKPTTDAVSRWLTTPRPMRSIGSYFDAEKQDLYFMPVTPSQDYDGFVYFERTTRAHPNPSVENVAP
ncbi:MAG TPA: erythromycin esterase family protein [Pyrinomonadaceae bacterium]|nr:erythromycin esterase family protein [Pyrinomonadaceae bacterium]